MRSLPSILVSFLIAGLGGSWLFFEAEIRDFLGWPVEEVVEQSEKEREKSERSAAPRVEKESPRESKTSERPAEPTREELINAIVSQRYPDLEAVSFSEKFPSPENISRAAYPDRVQSSKAVSFSERSGSAILGASRVKAGGFVHPEEIREDGVLLVSSLANPEMTAELSLSDTDMIERISREYEASLTRAQDRIPEMRSADASELKSNLRLFRRLEESDGVWSSDSEPEELIQSLFQKLDPETFTVAGHYRVGKMKVRTEDRSGVFDVTVFLVEGTDHGFGPYLWRIQSLEGYGKPVKWLGLPE